MIRGLDIATVSFFFSGESLNEEYDARVPVDIVPEDEVQLNEELQIILPPRCDDTAADSSTSSTLTDTSTSGY